jgi:hypothetical protein
MAISVWGDEQRMQLRKEDPLILANSTATMAPDDGDSGQALPPLYPTEPIEEVTTQEQRMKGAPWDLLNEADLKAILAQPVEGDLGCGCCRHLNRWKETCGRHEMMQIGMWTYWIDPTESPKRLRSDKRVKELKVNMDKRAAYQQLLQVEIDAEIVVEISFEDGGCSSPSFAVKKKRGPDGRVK